MKLAAVIFDLDGTVLDNEGTYGKAFSKVLSTIGIRCDSPQPHLGGIGIKANWENFLKNCDYLPNKSLEQLAAETQEAYISLLNEVRVRQGFETLARKLKNKNIKLALSTSNDSRVTELVLQKFNLKKFFDVVVTADDVLRLKPAPDLFLLTAQKLGVKPESCLVIEDSKAGVHAAKRAGMKVILVDDSFNATMNLCSSVSVL